MSIYVFNSQAFIEALQATPLETFADALALAVENQGHALKHGHLPGWEAAVAALPVTEACSCSIVDGAIVIDFPCDDSPQQASLKSALQALMPWRKGPFRFGSIDIETEWRSDWKWDRLEPHISKLTDRCVLDVGCGSGYHLWRMRKAGAAMVVGIDPSLLYVKQFEATQHFIQDNYVHLLPLPMEALPRNMGSFDTVFSMGVLYHRRDPHAHLRELVSSMTASGELVLETLVAPGETDFSLPIEGRYANMRNIYELPSVLRLCHWIEAAGLEIIKVADVSITSRKEQRSTDWMTSHSLAQALDAEDVSKTVEGYPRPLRAVVIARVGKSVQ
ncbi:MAG: tRNA 5-methoxyuridine(34)/uridine 5-oxyacetic acid(34) synthase CmoB [Granulosicoccus sp.]